MNSILVRDLMTVGVPTCKISTPLVDIAQFLLDNHLDEMVVLGEEGEGQGIVGYEELIDAYTKDDYRSLTAEEVMREGVPELPPEIPLEAAAHLMKDLGIRAAYMNHNSAGTVYPAAYISYKHLVRYLAARDEKDLEDLGISARREAPVQTFVRRRDEARRKAGLG
ncbi:MAG: CBS domain-containing protein [Anaerolineales bacterium]|nr:CBS domain-containing protein [Anaerolineales bacterium]